MCTHGKTPCQPLENKNNMIDFLWKLIKNIFATDDNCFSPPCAHWWRHCLLKGHPCELRKRKIFLFRWLWKLRATRLLPSWWPFRRPSTMKVPTLLNYNFFLYKILNNFNVQINKSTVCDWCHFFWKLWTLWYDTLGHRLNMELDLRSLFGLHSCAKLYPLAETRNPFSPDLGSYTRALSVS